MNLEIGTLTLLIKLITMGLFGRLFKIGEANANAIVDKLEDPIKMTDQAIRDLKVNLEESIKALAEVKALAIRCKNETDMNKNKAMEYESKAVAILQRAQSGAINQAEADRLAQSALEKKEEYSKSLAASVANQQKYEASVSKLESQIKKLKENISNWENEAKILKARAKVSDATASVNKQLAGIDSSSTVAMLERMKEKVEQKEALSESYAEIANSNVSVDEEINNVLESSSTSTSDALAALKQKLAIKGPDATDAP
jgi:phage shock protein A